MPVMPEVIVRPPESLPPEHGLLTSGLVLSDEEADGVDKDGNRKTWEGGFGFSAEACDAGRDVWVPCGVSGVVVFQWTTDATEGSLVLDLAEQTSPSFPFNIAAPALEVIYNRFLRDLGVRATVSVVGPPGGPTGGPWLVTVTTHSDEEWDAALANLISDPDDEIDGDVDRELIQDAETNAPPNVKSDYVDNNGYVSVTPYIIQHPYTCGSFGHQVIDYAGRAQRALSAHEGAMIEHEFWTGVNLPSNPNLRFWTPNTDAGVLNPGGAASPEPVSPKTAIAILESALANCGAGARGVIHLTTLTASLLGGGGGTLIEEDDILYTRTRRDLVVVGAGYPGTGPFGQPNPPEGTAWAFATGWVSVRLGDVEVIPGTFAEAFDRQTNSVTYRAERPAAVSHDGCCSFAVLVDISGASTSSGGGGESDGPIVYVWNGTDYIPETEDPGGVPRIFIGPEDPDGEGYDMVEGDTWYEVDV